jgi:hypothetical protein
MLRDGGVSVRDVMEGEPAPKAHRHGFSAPRGLERTAARGGFSRRGARKKRVTGPKPCRSGSEVFDVASGDVVGWVGVQAQVAVVGVAEAAFEFGAVVAAGLRQPVSEGVPQVVGA